MTTTPTPNEDQAFELVAQEGRIARTARMLDENDCLKPNQRADITERVLRFIEEHGITQAQVAREVGFSSSTISEVLRQRHVSKTGDRHLAALHNWLELAARRGEIIRSKRFVEITVAREIMLVAQTAAETCKIGVVYGPSHIGKTMTLEAIEGDQCFGDPVLIRVDEWLTRPLPLFRAMSERFELPSTGTFDTVGRRLVKRLADTKRMLIFDEADRLVYRSLESIRDLHDNTGCPILFAGKPAIYERLGFRHVDDFAERLDQMASRIIMRRDLTERTRGDNPQPLYTLQDIRKLIHQTGLKLDVSPDAEKWLQTRAGALGEGGIGKALARLYLAAKMAYAKGDATITSEHLEDVVGLSIGEEDAARMAEAVAQASGMRRVV